MSGRRFWLLHGVLPALLFLPLALVFEYTPVDAWVADQLYDPLRHGWIGGGSWWAKDLIHEAGRRLIAVIAASALTIWLLSYALRGLHDWRRAALLVWLSVLICTGLVAVIKHYSNVDCPEDLLRYGGDRAYVHIFADKPDDAARGVCFPGGHSSSAFSLFAFYFLVSARRARYAGFALLGTLMLGGVYAAGQWARGEHFVSHDTWSGVISWYVCLLMYRILYGTGGKLRVTSFPAMPDRVTQGG